jgi:hypothetical protein
MCGLCGVLGSEQHWADGTVADGAGLAVDTVPWLRRQARQRRVALANAIVGTYGVRISDWQGALFVLAGPTGRTEMANSLGDLWTKAELVAGKSIDPLDPRLLDALDARA